MKFQKSNLLTYLVLCIAVVFTIGVLSACKGSDGAMGRDGVIGPEGPAGSNGGDTVNINSLSADDMTNFKMTGTVTSVAMSAQPVVNFTVTDSNGRGVTGLGVASPANTANTNYTKLWIATLGADPTDSTTAWKTYFLDASSNPTNTGVVANIVDNGDGSYKYTFANSSITFDQAATHRVVVQISGNVPGISPNLPLANPLNIVYDFVPDGSTTLPTTREIVTENACNGCHTKLGDTRLDPSGNRFSTPGHGGRLTTKLCVTCHTPQMETNHQVSTADSNGVLTTYDGNSKYPGGSTWLLSNGTHTYAQMEFVTMIHKTHRGENLKLQYNAINNHYAPNKIGYPQDLRNCTTCHVGTNGDNWKTKPTMKACGSCHDNISWASSVPTGFVAHSGGHQSDDSHCALCHVGTSVAAPIETVHLSNYATTHNAGIPYAANFAYTVSKVTVANQVASITFGIKNNGTLVTLNSGGTGSVLPGFSGGPSFYVAYAVPEDGILNPSDWNSGHTSITLQNIYDGTKGTLTGPDGNGYYTATLGGGTANYAGLNIPPNATMVTGFMAGAFTQMNWSNISSDPTGSVRPGIASFKTADGYTARRVIVDPARCNTCHEQLGTDPNFHGGNYNVAMCAMCHTPNQGSSGWSASFRVWVHGIHGASKRTVPFTWHANSATDTFANLLYPGILNNCEQCHLPGTYDFSASQYTGNLINNMLNVVTASGTYASNSATAYRYSPYIALDYNYGTNYSIATDGTYTNAAGTTLVSSPITATCSSCHDASSAINHMKTNGGLFYAQRSNAPAQSSEACLVCHGKGGVEDIKVVHQY